MSAVVYEGQGVFTVGPASVTPPGPGEVRLDVAYCGICGTDLHIAHGAMDARIGEPRVIGHEMSGTVAEVGAGVEELRPGDPVVVRPLDTRDVPAADREHSHVGRNLRFIGIDSPGALQASWTVPAFTVHRVPPGLGLEHAAFAEPLAVACHDVRRAELEPGETAVVLGGGPIGLLIALVARAAGATVVVSEVNPLRIAFARSLGFDADSVPRLGDAGADVVFEVSGSPAAALAMTELAGLRGRIVVVAIHPDPPPIRLFDVFWKELELRGARVYEPEDYERAIELLASGALPLEQLITRVERLERLPAVFTELANGATDIKVLVDCST
jgi:2-desacetyl-2-hydroxyethyl bacteriochlorophyllide A dehydrogenase